MWDLTRRPQPWTADVPVLQRSFSLSDVRQEQEDVEVARVVLVQCVDDVEETRELLALSTTDECVAGVVGWLKLDDPRFSDHLAELVSVPGGERLVGLRHQLQIEPDKGWLDRAPVRDSLRRLGDAGRCSTSSSPRSSSDRWPMSSPAVPEARFVLDHCGNPPLRDGGMQQWRSDLAAVADQLNVAVKLSGLATHGAWGLRRPQTSPRSSTTFSACFGPGRTMFGSDWPACLLGASYGHVVSLADEVISGSTDAERNAVWSGTADVWYGLTHEG